MSLVKVNNYCFYFGHHFAKMAPELVTCNVSAVVIFQVEIVFEVGFKCSSSRIWGSFAGIYHVAHPVALGLSAYL